MQFVQTLLRKLTAFLPQQPCRFASKKSQTNTRNRPVKRHPKHRGWKVNDGHFVQKGRILATQFRLRWHPGLNVGLGLSGNLFALLPGRVAVTCERVNLNWAHTWVERAYSHRTDPKFYKKYFNVIPEPQHQNFRLISRV